MNTCGDATITCCAECGKEGGVSLKACMSCMSVKYCNAACQKRHWPKHKAACKLCATELRDKALFKDPPAKEDCPICFLPMPILLICCASLPPATLSSVPIHDFAIANGELADEETEQYYPCCGKSICGGCVHSCRQSGDDVKCPFCNSDRTDKTDEEIVGELMKRAEANDAASIYVLASFYQHGLNGFQQDHAKAIEFYARAAELGYSKAHYCLGNIYDLGGDLKKARFHFEAAAMAGNEVARYNIGNLEFKSGNINRAVKHWTIAASVGHYKAMHNLLVALKKGYVSTESIDSTLAAYNSSCVEMSYETREAYIRVIMGMDESTNNT